MGFYLFLSKSCPAFGTITHENKGQRFGTYFSMFFEICIKKLELDLDKNVLLGNSIRIQSQDLSRRCEVAPKGRFKLIDMKQKILKIYKNPSLNEVFGPFIFFKRRRFFPLNYAHKGKNLKIFSFKFVFKIKY